MKRIWKAIITVTILLTLSQAIAGGGTAYAAISRDDMPVLELKQLTEFEVPEGGSYLEGGTATSVGYLLTFMSTVSSLANPMMLLDTNYWQTIVTAYAMLSHANDMCYVPHSREIYVVPMDSAQIIVLDEDTLAVKRTINTPQIYHSIGYDTSQNCFAAVYVSGSGRSRSLHCDILDSTCSNVNHSFTIETNLTYQGLAVHNSLIYYTCWERGSTSVYEPIYDGTLQKDDNVIYVYDFSGNLQKALLVEKPAGYSKFEVETAAFVGNRMILQFNETLDAGGRRVALYEVVGEQKSAAQKAAEEKAAAQKAAAQQKERELAWSGISSRRATIAYVARRKRAIRLILAPIQIGTESATGYQVQICRKKNFKGSTLKADTITTPDCKIMNLKRRTTYYVRVRAYKTIGSNTYYSAWSNRKKVRTK